MQLTIPIYSISQELGFVKSRKSRHSRENGDGNDEKEKIRTFHEVVKDDGQIK
jgi:hypothetical protein